MKNNDLTKAFFEALNYPYYFRPNFFVNRQKETEWQRGIYLIGLLEVCNDCNDLLRIHYNINKNKKAGLKYEDIQVPIREITGGEENGFFNKEIIDELQVSIIQAGRFGNKKKEYSPLEIISFVEYALSFILKEFKAQIGEPTGQFSRPRTKTYFSYLIASEAPFLSFPEFKIAFRRLLIQSKNAESLKKIFQPFYKVSLEIVRLWNDKVYFLLDNGQSDAPVIPEIVNVQFHEEEMNHSWWNDHVLFDAYYPRHYSNQDFAYFAGKITNLLSSELLGGKQVKMKANSQTFLEDIICGIQKLLRKEKEAIFITEAKNGIYKEEEFGNWFSDWLEARKYSTSSETLKTNGHIDLLVSHEELGNKILEFKGWWNPKKKSIINQVYRYLTQLEGDACIIIINHTQTSIAEKYKAIITQPGTGYRKASWKSTKFRQTSFEYFISDHKLGPEIKKVYHFIISIY